PRAPSGSRESVPARGTDRQSPRRGERRVTEGRAAARQRDRSAGAAGEVEAWLATPGRRPSAAGIWPFPEGRLTFCCRPPVLGGAGTTVDPCLRSPAMVAWLPEARASS